MLWQNELEQLRQQRERLELECDARRALLALEWRLSGSPRRWFEWGPIGAARHPVLMAAVGLAAGVLGVALARRPAAVLRRLGRLGRAGPLVWSLWKLLRRN